MKEDTEAVFRQWLRHTLGKSKTEVSCSSRSAPNSCHLPAFRGRLAVLPYSAVDFCRTYLRFESLQPGQQEKLLHNGIYDQVRNLPFGVHAEQSEIKQVKLENDTPSVPFPLLASYSLAERWRYFVAPDSRARHLQALVNRDRQLPKSDHLLHRLLD
ncbi:hypothetical protein B0H19DRAFT_1074085 [Mycena capillaripes]|nr:hypothetical protein B0H19DRAFT_1074085 [Mycena capillaripes]